MDNNYDNTPDNENETAPGQDTTGQESADQGAAAQPADAQNIDTPSGTGSADVPTAAPGGSDGEPVEVQPEDTQKQDIYTDPNADYVQYQNQQNPYGNSNSQDYTYGGQNSQNYQYGGQNNQYGSPNNQEFNYQDNYNYNVGNNTGYNKPYGTGMDDSPMSMGDWVLTILIMSLVPCVGIVLYFVWAFSKNGNVNRRNYCRAYLIIAGIMFALVMIFLIIFGVAGLGLSGRYY